MTILLAPPDLAGSKLVRFTVDQFDALAHAGLLDDHGSTELRDGLVCEMAPQYVPHFWVKMALFRVLDRALVAFAPLEAGIEVSLNAGRFEQPMPDIIVWTPHFTLGAVDPAHVRLVIEVSETTQAQDLGRKRQVYARAGIAEYWIADIPDRTLHRFWDSDGNTYAKRDRIAFGERASSVTIAGLAIDTSALTQH